MKKYILVLLLAIMAGQVSGQLIIYGPGISFACAGGGVYIQTPNGAGTGFFWQLSTDNGNTWATLSDTGPYTGSSTGTLQIDPVAVSMNGYIYRYAATGNPTVFSNEDTLSVFTTTPNTPVFVSPMTSVCQGQTIVYTVTGNLTNDSASWSVVNGSSLFYTGINDTVSPVHFPTAGSATVYAGVNNGCRDFTESSISVTVNALQTMPAGTAGGGADCASFSVFPGAATTYSDGTCSPIAAITPSGASPVSGTVQSCVTVDASLPAYNGVPYVGRYYSIEPTTNPSTSTATITLYFTQADFDAYNTGRGSYPALPTGPSDATDISNLTISQFHGTGTTPDTYVGTNGTIVPASVTWNSTASRWEVTFSVTGFSGFFVSGSPIIPLPLTLTAFTGLATAAGNQLHWETSMEENTAYFDVERAIAGSGSFLSLDTVPAAGNSEQLLTYTYTDAQAGGSSYSYRLKMVDLDGSFTYSKIITLQSATGGFAISVSPNPYHQSLSVIVTMPEAAEGNMVVTDAAGHRILQQALSLQKGSNLLNPTALTTLAPGMYFLSVTTAQEKQTAKLIRE